jgi:hypothetical protein
MECGPTAWDVPNHVNLACTVGSKGMRGTCLGRLAACSESVHGSLARRLMFSVRRTHVQKSKRNRGSMVTTTFLPFVFVLSSFIVGRFFGWIVGRRFVVALVPEPASC